MDGKAAKKNACRIFTPQRFRPAKPRLETFTFQHHACISHQPAHSHQPLQPTEVNSRREFEHSIFSADNMGIPAKRTKTKTRRWLRSVDQVKEDILSPRHLEIYKETKANEDLPGLGQHYCIECAKWFETDYSLTKHSKGKPHKRRLKDLENPYTHKDADAAVGLWTDNGTGPEKAKSQEIDMMA
ncbi:hypothetical protein B0T17DRAFT_544592 [Bombardia bombarda]|uniref:C2H2-type domain-containing protein n=1 Tax=Bombardia bombarda TaxID=252184 RepID=A0AA39U3R7_9PEZI|nr:hypothetical protein B0T17DRAFT_544592 [Bombardia bombarda]